MRETSAQSVVGSLRGLQFQGFEERKMTDPLGMKQGLGQELCPQGQDRTGQLRPCLVTCELPQQDPSHLQILVTQCAVFPEISP